MLEHPAPFSSEQALRRKTLCGGLYGTIFQEDDIVSLTKGLGDDPEVWAIELRSKQ